MLKNYSESDHFGLSEISFKAVLGLLGTWRERGNTGVKTKGPEPHGHYSPLFLLPTGTVNRIIKFLDSANDRAPGRRQSWPQRWRQKSFFP